METQIENYLSFNTEQLKNLTRLDSYKCKIPRIRNVSSCVIEKYVSPQPIQSPCEHKYLPPEETLKTWRSELQKAVKLAAGCFYLETDFGRYNLDTINVIFQLYKACSLRKFVKEGIDWFSESCTLPPNVLKVPDKVNINNFKSKIHRHPYDTLLPGYDMTPDEMSQICKKRLLSGDHMRYVANILSKQQDKSLCVYVNSIKDVKKFIEKRSITNINKLVLLLHVGKKRYVENGTQKWKVFISDDNNRGCHFSAAFVDLTKGEMMYGDSLGWEAPVNLIQVIEQYSSLIKENSSEFSLEYFHKPTGSSTLHSCSSCTIPYPLQRDSNVCGIVAIIMASIFCLEDVNEFKICHNYYYLIDPTKYNKFLRLVFICWLSEEKMDLSYLSSQRTHLVLNESPEPELNDQDDVVLVDFLTEEEDKNDEEIKPNKPFSVEIKKTHDNKFKKCKHCEYETKKLSNLKRHIERKHGKDLVKEVSGNVNRGCLCLDCGHHCQKIRDLQNHLVNKHEHNLRLETKHFKCDRDFLDWKEEKECKEQTSFYLSSTGVNKDDEYVQYLQCNRCGYFKSRSKNKRGKKHGGSCKINRNCTCTLKVTKGITGEVTAEACWTHYGHSKNLAYSWISKKKRNEIAAKLQQGVTHEKILDDIRDNIGTQFIRDHIVDKQDLANIQRAYGLDEVTRHANDQTSVLSWIQEWENSEYSPVLYYKLQGQDDPENHLHSDDFIIVVQTDFQRRLMQQFGSKGLCSDSTHGTTGYDISTDEDFPDASLLAKNIDHLEEYFDEKAWLLIEKTFKEFLQSWTCSKCKQAENINMICCDSCDKWYHWKCVGIKRKAPVEWFCDCEMA